MYNILSKNDPNNAFFEAESIHLVFLETVGVERDLKGLANKVGKAGTK